MNGVYGYIELLYDRLLGYTEADIRQIVEGTMKQQRMLVGCPRPVGEKDLTKIAREAMRYW